jgi:hypothetical protein
VKEETGISRQQCSKHTSVAMNKQETTEELLEGVLSLWLVPTEQVSEMSGELVASVCACVRRRGPVSE